MNSIQQITIKFTKFNKSFVIISVYARCTALQRLELWEELESIVADELPWMVGGDLNIILNEDQMLGK